jgi:O-antigen/teichoic acid export membrane protein
MLKKILRQSFVYFSTLVAGKLLTAGFFILLARILQPRSFGVITYFITVVQFISVLADFGLKSWYQKQMANCENKSLLKVLFHWRLSFWLVSLGGIIISQYFISWLPSELLGAIILALLLEALISVSDGYYLARKKSLKLGYKLIARNLLLFISLLWIHTPADYVYFFTAYNLVLVVVLIFYFPYQKLLLAYRVSPTACTLKAALPYATLDSLGVIYSKTDSLLVEHFLGSASLGIYGAAYRYLDAFNLLPQALFHNLFPVAAKKNAIGLKQVKKMVLLMTGIGLLVAAGVFIGSNLLTTILMGEAYAPAAEILRYFSLVIILFFFNAPMNTIIQSSDTIKHYLPWLTLTVMMNLGANLFLLPRYGLMGAVGAMIGSELFLVFINLYFIKKIYQLHHSQKQERFILD